MLAVRLEDGTTVYAFGGHSVVARNRAGAPDAFWQQAAEASVAEHDGDLYRALVRLPGAKLIHEGQVAPSPVRARPPLHGSERLIDSDEKARPRGPRKR